MNGDIDTKSFKLDQGGKRATNSSGTNLTSQRLASGEGHGCPSLIPGSVLKYVTGVNERSQRTCSLKYEGYITIKIIFYLLRIEA